jgi:hypothetical protein
LSEPIITIGELRMDLARRQRKALNRTPLRERFAH